jgi:hypothetical protein
MRSSSASLAIEIEQILRHQASLAGVRACVCRSGGSRRAPLAISAELRPAGAHLLGPLDGACICRRSTVIGYNKANTSRTLKLFLSRLDELIARVSKKFGDHADGSEGDAR